MAKRKKVCMALLGNAYYDSRILNFYDSLTGLGFDVRIVSFEWFPRAMPSRRENIKVFKLKKFKPTIIFYLAFYSILLKEFLFESCDYFFAEDVFVLPFAAFLKKLRNFKLVYDSRELYPFLAGLRNKTKNQALVAKVEAKFIRTAEVVLVTGVLDAEFLRDYYALQNIVVQRNLPRKTGISPVDLRKKFGISKEEKILVYQGVLQEGRGIELIIKALKHLSKIRFVIFGEGVAKGKFERLARENNAEGKIVFAGSIPYDELLNYTAGADLGVALIENVSKSYYYALPNKLFEYIAAGVPVVASDLPQMKQVIEKYRVGEIVKDTNEISLAKAFEELLADETRLDEYKVNCRKAYEELNWEKEFLNNKGAILE